jgi:hypothetical protein
MPRKTWDTIPVSDLLRRAGRRPGAPSPSDLELGEEDGVQWGLERRQEGVGRSEMRKASVQASFRRRASIWLQARKHSVSGPAGGGPSARFTPGLGFVDGGDRLPSPNHRGSQWAAGTWACMCMCMCTCTCTCKHRIVCRHYDVCHACKHDHLRHIPFCMTRDAPDELALVTGGARTYTHLCIPLQQVMAVPEPASLAWGMQPVAQVPRRQQLLPRTSPLLPLQQTLVTPRLAGPGDPFPLASDPHGTALDAASACCAQPRLQPLGGGGMYPHHPLQARLG